MVKREKYNPTNDAIESLARCLYPAMVAYFEREEDKKEFAEWQTMQGKDNPRLEGEAEQVA